MHAGRSAPVRVNVALLVTAARADAIECVRVSAVYGEDFVLSRATFWHGNCISTVTQAFTIEAAY